MKAIVQSGYGGVERLALGERAPPTPRADEVLVRVRAASLHADVWHTLTGLPHVLRVMGAGVRRPRQPVPGTDLAGVVEAVGAKVTRFRPGDEVFGETLRGHQWTNGGAFAELAAAPETGMAHKPPNVSFEQAAAVPTSGLIAHMNLRGLAGAPPGAKVLVNGAAGGVGSIALQLARARGANVTAVDAPDKLDILRELGADHVIDYTRVDFTREAERYDFIFDVPGNHPVAACRRALTPDGQYVLIGHDQYGHGMRRWLGLLPKAIGLVLRSLFVRQLRSMGAGSIDKPAAMAELAALLADGQLTPHVDRVFPMAQIADALEHLMSGRVRGKIVLTGL
jgi:NADPH:quinone reductase-like Zn-dependent oxidoreductase